jgi:hypothetical protein
MQEREQAPPSSADNWSKPRRASSASFRCSPIADSIVAALPSCISGRLTRSPHRAGVRISAGAARSCWMPSPVPTSCSNKSEKRGTFFLLNSGFALGPVTNAGTWQAAQPIGVAGGLSFRQISYFDEP